MKKDQEENKLNVDPKSIKDELITEISDRKVKTESESDFKTKEDLS